LARCASGEERVRLMRRAHELYAQLASDTGDPYPAINAATTALHCADKQQAMECARIALAAVDAERDEGYWNGVVASEALLLLGLTEEAAAVLAQACEHRALDLSSRMSTLRQIAEIVELYDVDFEPLDLAGVTWTP
jgi:hypothetical protein